MQTTIKGAKLKSLNLTSFITGIKRFPALQCSTMQNVDLLDYEIALMEPLHDFKNVINRIIQELPETAANEPALRKVISDTLLTEPGFESYLRPVEFFSCNKVSPLNNRTPTLTSVPCAPIN